MNALGGTYDQPGRPPQGDRNDATGSPEKRGGLRILMACAAFPPFIDGGGPISAMIVAKLLIAAGHDVQVVNVAGEDKHEVFDGVPVAAIDTVGIPMIAARFQKSDNAGAQLLIGRLSFASFCISLLGAVVLVLIAPFILSTFNADFAQHADVLTALCVLSVSQAFFGPGSWLLMIGGGERFFLIARAVIFIFYLGLLYGLAQIGGLMGIAIAGLFMTLASNLAAWHWIRRKYAIDNMATAFFRPFAFAGAPPPTTIQSGAESLHDEAAVKTVTH